MGKKIIVIASMVFAFALSSNAGTETIEPYRAPAPRYNYAPPPPPRPIFYAPRPVVGVVVAPGFGFYGRGYGFYGHRFYGRRAYWREHRRYWR